MNYAQARKRALDGRWDWTVKNDNDIWRAPCCRAHTEGHETAIDAERCYWNWELDQPAHVYVDETSQQKCVVCSVWTTARLRLGDGYTTFVLCESHQDRASLEIAYPFEPGRQLIYS